MSVTTFSSLTALTAAVDRQADQFDVISFDIFDTLLIRRLHDPDLVKDAVTRFIMQLADQHNVWNSYDRVSALRNSVEAEHRQRNGQSNPDYEANYTEFMTEALQQLFGEHYCEAIYNSVADYEVKIENAMLVARQPIVELLERLKQQGKRLFLISDMYLPASIIRRLIADKGLDHYFEDIISSADSFQAKASGSAYPLVQQRHDLDRARWLHIGDNPISDGLRPDEFGIQAFVIHDEQEKKRLGLAKRYQFYAKRHVAWKGRYIQQLMLPLEGENIERSGLYADGYQFFAYLLGSALYRLKTRIDRLGIRRLYFCSREGWILKQCWELMAPWLWPAEADNYQLTYLYVSRLSLAKASRAQTGLNIFDAENALRPVNNRDFTDIARVYGLDLEPLKPFLERYYLGVEEELSADRRDPKSFDKLVALCDDQAFQEAIKAQAAANGQALENYLTEQNFFAGSEQRVALIDIGWLSTIQHYLTSAVQHRDDRPIVNGFLLATDGIQYYHENSHSEVEGLAFDAANFASLPWLLTTCKDIFEEVTRAEHPTLLSYEPDDEKGYRLQFRAEDDASFIEEKKQFEYYSEVHVGVFDGIQRFAAAQAICCFTDVQLQKWNQVLILGRLGFPKADEAGRLRNFFHQDDFARQESSGPISRKAQREIKAAEGVWGLSNSQLRWNPLAKLMNFYRIMRTLRRR